MEQKRKKNYRRMYKKDEKAEELCESAQHNDDDRVHEIIIKRRTKYW